MLKVDIGDYLLLSATICEVEDRDPWIYLVIDCEPVKFVDFSADTLVVVGQQVYLLCLYSKVKNEEGKIITLGPGHLSTNGTMWRKISFS
jgi:hypothetical protein